MVERVFWPAGRPWLPPELQGNMEGKKRQKMGLQNLHHKRPSLGAVRSHETGVTPVFPVE